MAATSRTFTQCKSDKKAHLVSVTSTSWRRRQLEDASRRRLADTEITAKVNIETTASDKSTHTSAFTDANLIAKMNIVKATSDM